MARKRSRDRRLTFFRRGNTHCPICLAQFTEEDVRRGRRATLEHAPPKTMGGQEVCLTCERCNSLASATSDQAVKRQKSPPELQFDICGIKRSARFWRDGIPPSKMPYRFGTSSAAMEAQRELRNQTIVAVTAPVQFDQATTISAIHVSQKMPNLRHVELSYLRSAYLLVFSLLGRSGYVYAQSEAVGLIRRRILNPGDPAVPTLVRKVSSKASARNVITLRNTERPFFWSVRFDDGACVLLPQGGSVNHYRQIAGLPDNQTIGGRDWEPQRFGSINVARHRHAKRFEKGLFGIEYMTISDDGREQRWTVVNQVGHEVGDAIGA